MNYLQEESEKLIKDDKLTRGRIWEQLARELETYLGLIYNMVHSQLAKPCQGPKMPLVIILIDISW